MVKKLVKKYELFLCYNHLPEGINVVGFHFIRTTRDPVPTVSDVDEARTILPRCFETGTTSKKPLNALERLLTHVYIPMLMIQGVCVCVCVHTIIIVLFFYYQASVG